MENDFVNLLAGLLAGSQSDGSHVMRQDEDAQVIIKPVRNAAIYLAFGRTY